MLAFAFQRDKRQAINAIFLQEVQTAQLATTIYNVMEVLGQLSFNLPPERLAQWESWLVNAYQLTVIWMAEAEKKTGLTSFQEELVDRPFQKMLAKRMAYMDALVLSLAERAPDAQHFVTWNAKHFKEKTNLSVLTPEEYLKS
jgi:cobalamin-dependent methionine synthase I